MTHAPTIQAVKDAIQSLNRSSQGQLALLQFCTLIRRSSASLQPDELEDLLLLCHAASTGWTGSPSDIIPDYFPRLAPEPPPPTPP